MVLSRKGMFQSTAQEIRVFIPRLNLKRGGNIIAPLIPELSAFLQTASCSATSSTHLACGSELRRVTKDTREGKIRNLRL